MDECTAQYQDMLLLAQQYNAECQLLRQANIELEEAIAEKDAFINELVGKLAEAEQELYFNKLKGYGLA